jgi:hypothetical protein
MGVMSDEHDDYADRLPDPWWVRRRDLVATAILVAIIIGLAIVALPFMFIGG